VGYKGSRGALRMAFSKLEFGRAWQMPGLLQHKSKY